MRTKCIYRRLTLQYYRSILSLIQLRLRFSFLLQSSNLQINYLKYHTLFLYHSNQLMPRYSDRSSSSSSQKRPERSTRRQDNSPRKREQTQPIQQTKVFVTNLPGGIKVEDIRHIFEKQGKIIEMFVVDKQKYANAFVHYEEEAAFLNAIKNVNGFQFQNRTIKCEPAKPRVPRQRNQYKQNSRNERPRDAGNRPRGCFKCGKEGHLAKDCNNPTEGNNYDNKPKRINEDRRDNRQGHRDQRRRDQRRRDQSDDSRNKTSKKRRDRKRSSSSSSFERRPQRRRERSDSNSHHRSNKRREIMVRKRKRTPSSSKSNDRHKLRRHNRSRSAQLRKGKRRNVSRSSSPR